MSNEIEDKFFQALEVAEGRLAEINEQLKHYEVTFFQLNSEREGLTSTIVEIRRYLKNIGAIGTIVNGIICIDCGNYTIGKDTVCSKCTEKRVSTVCGEEIS